MPRNNILMPLLALLFNQGVWASASGQFEHSNNPSAAFGSGQSCAACHSATTHTGYSASITKNGSSSFPRLNNNSSYTDLSFRLTRGSTGTQASGAGFGLSVTSGTLVAQGGENTKVKTTTDNGGTNDTSIGKEIVHSSKKTNSSNSYIWNYTWSTPSTVGNYTFYACGNPVNDLGTDADDGTVRCTTNTVTVNTSPTAANDPSITHSEDGGNKTISPLTNDTAGGSGDTKTLVGYCLEGTANASCTNTSSSFSLGLPGTLSKSGNNIIYTPASNYNGAFTFEYRMQDSAGSTSNAEVTVTVSAQNDNPVITQGASTTVNMSEDSSPTPFSLTLNSTDPDAGATFAWSILTQAGNGTAAASGSGSSKTIAYTPTANYNGADSFVVRVTDNTGRTDDMTVNVNIAARNDNPIITEGASTTVNMSEDSSPTPFSLTLNATDADAGASFTWSVFTQAGNGTATANGSGNSKAIAYTPTANYNGSDSFVVRVTDNTGRTDDITVNVNISAQNDNPIITEGVSTTVNMSEDSSPTPFSLTLNATDADAGASFTWSVFTQAGNGTATASGSGSSKVIAYTPTANYNGADNFIIRVTDNTGRTDNITINVNLAAQNDSPTAATDTPADVNEDTTNNSIDVLANDIDVDISREGDTRQVIALCPSATASAASCTASTYSDANGSVSLSAASVNNTALFTPTTNYNGPFSFKYKMQDGSGVVSMALVSITVLPVSDSTPVANIESISLNEGGTETSLVGGATSVLTNDTGLTDTPITITQLSSPAYAIAFTFNTSDGTFSYQHNGSENFSDNFSYRIQDLDGESDTALVSISISPVSDATPTAVGDSINVAEGGTATSVVENAKNSVLANDTGLLDTPSVVTVVTTPVFASSFVLNTDGTFSYKHDGSENFNDSFRYRITDNDGQASIGLVSILISKVSDSTPTTMNDPVSVAEGGTVTTVDGGASNVMANDSGLLDTPVVVSLKTAPSQSSAFTLNSDGTFSYSHNGGEVHTDSFVYTLTDNDGESIDGTANITVSNVNDAPVALSDHSFPNVLEDSTNNLLNVLSNDTDSDVGDTKQITALCAKGTADAACTTTSYTPASGSVTLNSAATGNQVVLNPALNANGLFEFKYKMQDTAGLPAYAEASITVTAVNDAPLISSTSQTSVIELVQYQYQVAVTDPDDSGSGLEYSLIGAPSGMSVTLNGGLITWTPGQNTANTYNFSVQVADGGENFANPAIEAIALTVSTADIDADTIADYDDNCPNTVNTDQANNDADSEGDLCDTDDDNDSMLDSYEIANSLDPFNAADAALDNDGDGLTNAQEAALGSNPNADTVPPVITASTININATGPLTAVSFAATAEDALDGVINTTTSSNTGPFLSGAHTVTWRAEDLAGNIATLDQLINIAPLASVAASQLSGEGRALNVTLLLSGPAATYPVSIDYLVSGSAIAPADHDLVAGSVNIASGLSASLPVNIASDAVIEGSEEIVISLNTASNAVVGTQNQQTITIVEQQIAPRLTLSASQGATTSVYIYKNQGPVLISIDASDGNGDTLSYDWSAVSDINFNPVPTTLSSSATFDPSTLTSAMYSIPVSVSDGSHSVSSTINLLLADTAKVLTTADSDGDGVDDITEGAGDSDADLQPDYLDPIDQANLINTFVSPLENNYLNAMQTETGLSLKMGRSAIAANASGTQVSIEDINKSSSVATDTEYTQISSLFDFEVHGLNSIKSTAQIVIPLSLHLPVNAVYRKYDLTAGWNNFVEDSQNSIKSANSIDGVCPSIMDASYVAGLQLLADCIELTLSDGGANDADGLVNGIIVDPGGISIPNSSTPDALLNASLAPASSVNAGGSSAFNMMFLSLLLLIGLYPVVNKK